MKFVNEIIVALFYSQWKNADMVCFSKERHEEKANKFNSKLLSLNWVKLIYEYIKYDEELRNKLDSMDFNAVVVKKTKKDLENEIIEMKAALNAQNEIIKTGKIKPADSDQMNAFTPKQLDAIAQAIGNGDLT